MLYNPNLTIIFTGDTNTGKTTTFNTLVKKWTKLDCNFYCESGQNKTKITTIFHFCSNEYALKYNGMYNTYETFDKLQTGYNDASKNGSIDTDDINFCYVFIKEGKQKINFIDTIGKSQLVTSSYFDSLMKSINKQFPNNINICLIRTPTRDLNFNDNIFYVIMFADLIDYITDKTIEDIHYDFYNQLENKLFFYSNNQVKTNKIIKTKEVTFHGYDSLHEMLNKMIEISQKQLIIPTKNVYNLQNDDAFKKAMSVDDVLNLLNEYNDKLLYNTAENYINSNNLLTIKEMNDIYQNAITDRENHRIPGFGLTRLTQIVRSNFEKGCYNREFFDKMIKECNNYIAKNSNNTTNKYFEIFDMQRRHDIEELSISFAKRLVQKILSLVRKRKFRE